MGKCAVVVGGGIIGIASALLLKKSHDDVYLIEKAPSIGGLLNSMEEQGSYYDFGTHIPGLTGQEELDDLLFELDSDFPGWYEIPYLKVANYHNAHWNPESPLIDIRTLGSDYDRALEEFLSLPEADTSEENLGRFIEDYFGSTIAEKVYRPVFQKLHGTDINNLSQKILYNFCLHRVIAMDSEKTKELKKDPKYDSKLGFHSYRDVPENSYRYPRSTKGSGEWILALNRKLSKAGVKVITGASITEVEADDNRISAIKINDEKLECDDLIWTIPPVFLQKMTKQKMSGSPPKFRHATLLNLKLNKPVMRDNHYVFIWDPSVSIFRMTFYKNLRENLEEENILTLEYLSDGPCDEEAILSSVSDELAQMNLINQEHEIIEKNIHHLGPAFPILSEEYIANTKETREVLTKKFNNLKILGKTAGKNFLLSNLLLDAHEELSELR